MKKSEEQIETYLSKKVKSVGGLSLKWSSPGRSGVPDRILIFPEGDIHFVELKAEGKRGNLSTLQRSFIKKLECMGCKVHVIASYEEVEAFISNWEKS